MGPYDVGVIGGGPGGYTAAIRATQLGGKVVLIEKESLGGTCLNVGCIPTKALLRCVELLSDIRDADKLGITVAKPSFNILHMMELKDEIVKRLADGIKYLLDHNGVELIEGEGCPLSQHEILLSTDSESAKVETKSIIIATGSKPKMLPTPGTESKSVITSDTILRTREVPRSMLIIGGGAEGCEFASIFSRLGCETTIVDMLPHLLPQEDDELGLRLRGVFSELGVKVIAGGTVSRIEEQDGSVKVTVSSESGESVINIEKVLLAAGRVPNIEGLSLDAVGISFTRKGISVNERMETSVKGIYAVGDVVSVGLAHVAAEQGVVAAENAMGLDSKFDPSVIPRCIYTIPEVAAVGLTSRQAREQGYSITTGKFPFSASGRAFTLGETRGWVKLIADRNSRRILGVHIIGPRASEIISEAALAIKMNARLEDVGRLMHPHPTLSEALKEAALDADGLAINLAGRKAR